MIQRISEVREQPILFSAPMVRAILEGRKTQTRRVIQPQFNNIWGRGCPNEKPFVTGDFYSAQKWKDAYAVQVDIQDANGVWKWLWCPYGKTGDRLWVRETLLRCQDSEASLPLALYNAGRQQVYRAGELAEWIWKVEKLPSIYMPRWASRIALEITKVRVERLQEISFDDALAEGIISTRFWDEVKSEDLPDHPEITDPDEGINQGWHDYVRIAFEHGWDSINGKRGHTFASNPWVWVIEFSRLPPPTE